LFLSQLVFSQKRDLLPDSLVLCWGDSSVIELRDLPETNFLITWTTPQGIVTNTKRLNAQRQGNYSVLVTTPGGGKQFLDTCFVRIAYKVKPLLRDTAICRGRSLTLDARHSGLRYQWSTGETTQRIQIDSPGRYWVRIRNGACVTVDSVRVRQLPGMVVTVPSELTFCANEEKKAIIARGSSNTRYYWSTGVSTSTTQINKEGTYWLRSETGLCGKQVDTIKVRFKMCECEMIIPNSFSPNEDNKNDYFSPQSTCEYSYYFISISDRWGNSVYSSTNPNGRWDGRFKGNLCPEDIYLYRIESTEKGGEKKLVRTGKVSLFR
jgi:gliding motility-associated-like protein